MWAEREGFCQIYVRNEVIDSFLVITVSTEDLLSKLSTASPHMAVYDKKHLPRRLHYARHHRIDDIILVMEEGWVVSRYVFFSVSSDIPRKY